MKKKKKEFISNAINISSLLIAFVSLIISVIALKIAERTLDLSSKDYIPQFEYNFRENGEIKISNPNSDLYQIEFIKLIKIKIVGVEHYNLKGFIEIPFITESKLIRNLTNKKSDANWTINANMPGPCAYICPYDQNFLADFTKSLNTEFNLESEIGYMLPSLQSSATYIEIYYRNKNKERKSIVFSRTFLHGNGYDEQIISTNEFDYIINNANHPKFKSIEGFKQYAFEKYLTPFN